MKIFSKYLVKTVSTLVIALFLIGWKQSGDTVAWIVGQWVNKGLPFRQADKIHHKFHFKGFIYTFKI